MYDMTPKCKAILKKLNDIAQFIAEYYIIAIIMIGCVVYYPVLWLSMGIVVVADMAVQCGAAMKHFIKHG